MMSEEFKAMQDLDRRAATEDQIAQMVSSMAGGLAMDLEASMEGFGLRDLDVYEDYRSTPGGAFVTIDPLLNEDTRNYARWFLDCLWIQLFLRRKECADAAHAVEVALKPEEGIKLEREEEEEEEEEEDDDE